MSHKTRGISDVRTQNNTECCGLQKQLAHVRVKNLPGRARLPKSHHMHSSTKPLKSRGADWDVKAQVQPRTAFRSLNKTETKQQKKKKPRHQFQTNTEQM